MDEKNKKRKSLRLKNYDYLQQGLYFITICIHQKLCLLGRVNNDEMFPNAAGLMLESCWYDMSKRFVSVRLDEFVLMPNHFHGIIELTEKDVSLGEVVGAFKSITTNKYIRGVKENNWRPFVNKFWQRNYYEHVIRNEYSYQQISEYIKYNPAKWCDDQYYRTN